ncbi:serine recombinase [Bodo saltans virus]|uniref:Serine recombinase n=1 Tax=Bodo saltans virus TaxID=2024608 RepID=A0A2H4UUQ0_9VIRU|nr:serine recombinase [Bodo saltans virus]ATZ80587.1 serine recombinase [Bodo saltans virus]
MVALNDESKNGYIYCRQSKKLKKSNSLLNQHKICKKYCEKNKIKVKKTKKEHKSGRFFKNKASLMELRNKMVSGDTLVVYRISRLSRNYEKGWNFIKTLKENNIKVVSVDENINSFDNINEFQEKLKSSEDYSNELSDRINKINRCLRHKGWHFGYVPYGYERYFTLNNVRKMRPNNTEQYVIKLINRLRKNKKSYKEISKFLNKKRLLFRKKYWDSIMVGTVYRKHNKK